MHIWISRFQLKMKMLRLIPEPTNSVDRNAVAVMKEGQIVGHVPFNLSPIISLYSELRALLMVCTLLPDALDW